MIYEPIDPGFLLCGYTGLLAAIRHVGWETPSAILDGHGGIGMLKAGLNLNPNRDPLERFRVWSLGWGKADDIRADAAG